MQISQFLDSFLNKGGSAFKTGKCKTLLKLSLARIKLLRNKREIQIRQMRRDLAQLLEKGQETTALVRVESIIREKNILAAYDTLELFCELIVARLPIIESQRECPLDARKAIASIVFAAPRCTDLVEFVEIRNLFAAKYGREFIAAATELRPDCGVDLTIVKNLSVHPPDSETKLQLMKNIAEEHNIEWNPSTTEATIFKLSEDLLDGPAQFVSASELPLSGRSGGSKVVLEMSSIENPQFDDLLDDLPSPPKTNSSSLRHGQISDAGGKSSRLSVKDSVVEDSRHDAALPTEKQFIPFLAPIVDKKEAPQPDLIWGGEHHNRKESREGSFDYQDVIEAAQVAAESADKAARAARATAELAKSRMLQGGVSQIEDKDKDDEDGDDDDSSDESKSASKNQCSRQDLHQNTSKDANQIRPRFETNDIFDVNLDAVEARKAIEVEHQQQTSNKYGDDAHNGFLDMPKKKEEERQASFDITEDSGHPFSLSQGGETKSKGTHVGNPLYGHSLYESPSLDAKMPPQPDIFSSPDDGLYSPSVPPRVFPPSFDGSFHGTNSLFPPERSTSFENESYYAYPNLFSASSGMTSVQHNETSSTLSTHDKSDDDDDVDDDLAAQVKALKTIGGPH